MWRCLTQLSIRPHAVQRYVEQWDYNVELHRIFLDDRGRQRQGLTTRQAEQVGLAAQVHWPDSRCNGRLPNPSLHSVYRRTIAHGSRMLRAREPCRAARLLQGLALLVHVALRALHSPVFLVGLQPECWAALRRTVSLSGWQCWQCVNRSSARPTGGCRHPLAHSSGGWRHGSVSSRARRPLPPAADRCPAGCRLG